MEEIDRELLIKEISIRLFYGVKAQVYKYDEEKGKIEVSLKIYSINTDGYVYFEINKYDINYLPIDDCRLYLRPLYSMTEEELEEFRSFHCVHDLHPYFYPTMCNMPNLTNMFNWLNKHHIDYRGLIPKGLALEAPDRMYNIK